MRILAAVSTKLFSSTVLLSVDFAMTSVEVMRSLHQTRFDVLVLETLADQPATPFAEKLRSEGWPIPIILLSEVDPKLQGVLWVKSPGSPAEIEQALQKISSAPVPSRDDDKFSMLLTLTRDSVSTQTFMAAQIAGMRQDLSSFQQGLDQKLDGLRAHGDKQREMILAGVDNSIWRKIRDILGWSTEHPLAATAFFFAFLILLVAMALALRVAGPDNIKLLRDTLPSASQNAG